MSMDGDRTGCACVPVWSKVTRLMRDVVDLVDVFYQIPGCETGGPLHITTDDNNVTDHNLMFCWQQIDAVVEDDPDHRTGWWRECQTPDDTTKMVNVGRAILWGLASMTEAERLCVATQTYRDVPFDPWPPYEFGLSYWQEDVLDARSPGDPIPEWLCEECASRLAG